jgi:hypothetical protein
MINGHTTPIFVENNHERPFSIIPKANTYGFFTKKWLWGTDIPRVHQKDKIPHEKPVGPIIREVIPSWAWEERPIRRIDTRLDQRRPRRPDGFEQ